MKVILNPNVKLDFEYHLNLPILSTYVQLIHNDYIIFEKNEVVIINRVNYTKKNLKCIHNNPNIIHLDHKSTIYFVILMSQFYN